MTNTSEKTGRFVRRFGLDASSTRVPEFNIFRFSIAEVYMKFRVLIGAIQIR
jgi:hypothetical protein